MIGNENKILLELEEIGQAIAKKREKKELEAKRLNLAITWMGGSIFTGGLMYFLLENPWNYIYMFAACAVIGLPFIFWASSRLKKVNQEIEKLERKRKELKNSIR